MSTIVPMLQVTRTWNSVMAAATIRRGVALARDYARRGVAFSVGWAMVYETFNVM